MDLTRVLQNFLRKPTQEEAGTDTVSRSGDTTSEDDIGVAPYSPLYTPRPQAGDIQALGDILELRRVSANTSLN